MRTHTDAAFIEDHQGAIGSLEKIPRWQPITVRIQILGEACPVLHHDVLQLHVLVWDHRFPVVQQSKYIRKFGAVVGRQGAEPNVGGSLLYPFSSR